MLTLKISNHPIKQTNKTLKELKSQKSSLVYKGNFFLFLLIYPVWVEWVHRGETVSAATEGPQWNYQQQGIISKQLTFCFANKTPC